ncbi:MAG: hypothetical protein H6568_05410 [Lewinellaceae bacterium]|nr:hypothetical protein [Lewinellaceae bacterium]
MTETEKGFGHCGFEFVCDLYFVIRNFPEEAPNIKLQIPNKSETPNSNDRNGEGLWLL